MKVDELRAKLYQLKQDEVIRLAIEFYKLVPKAKKEEYNLDALIQTPGGKPTKPTAIDTLVSFEGMAASASGARLRPALTKLLATLQKKDELPQFM